MQKKRIGKRTLYFVKWEGFPVEQGTWEPINNLKNIKDMVKEFDAMETKKALLATIG